LPVVWRFNSLNSFIAVGLESLAYVKLPKPPFHFVRHSPMVQPRQPACAPDLALVIGPKFEEYRLQFLTTVLVSSC